MRTNDSFNIRISDDDRALLEQASRAIWRHSLRTEPELYVVEAQLYSAGLSEDLRRQLARFRRFGNESAALIIEGIPVGLVPETPRSADLAVGMSLPAAAAMSVLVAPLGEQYGFKPELAGYPVQDILPVAGYEQTQQSISATVILKMHVEMAFSPYRCDYVVLMCLRQDHDRVAGTTVSSIDRILPLLEAGTIATLREPRYRTTVDESFLRGEGLQGPLWVDGICPLSGPRDRPHLRVDYAETEGTDAEAAASLQLLEEAAVEVAVDVKLKAGDMVIIDNRRSFHGRTPFAPRYDGRDRWLLRTFVTRDLARSEAVRPGVGGPFVAADPSLLMR